MNVARFYAVGLLRQLVPYGLARRRTEALLKTPLADQDLAQVAERVGYYNRLTQDFDASHAPRICKMSKQKSRYYLDLDEISRGFGPDRRLAYLFGDICHVPDVPTVVKSRPIAPDNHNSVLLNLDKLRHFSWTPDPLPFRAKTPTAVWRGTPLTEQRRELVRRFYHHPRFDIGHSRHQVDDLPPKPTLTHAQQMTHKFFVSLEGNDVATNLKWGLASNMLVMAPRPRFETWFMEGRLEANRHYVPLRDDLSDLEAKVAHFTAHPDAAEEIIRNAHAWVAQFADPTIERLIAARVLERYFALSGQV